MSQDILNLVQSDAAGGPARLRVDVIGDFVCPWSYLGKRRLDHAMRSVYGATSVTWYPFQLNPEMPAEGMGFDEYLTHKFGDPAALEPALQHLQLLGQTEGAPMHFDRIRRVPNTLSAHRLMRQAGIHQCQAEAAAALYRSFFELGDDIGERGVIEALALELGFSKRDVCAVLDDENTLKAVQAAEAQARRAGITGVPNFLINRRLFVVGAQDSVRLLEAIDRAMFGDNADADDATLH